MSLSILYCFSLQLIEYLNMLIRAKLLRQARKDRHTPEFTLVRNELRGTPWASRLSQTTNTVFLDTLEALGPLHYTCLFLRLPEDLQPMSADFKRGIQHHKETNPVLQFIFDHPVHTLNSDRTQSPDLIELEKFLEENGFYPHQYFKIHNLIDGYSTAAMFLAFNDHWRRLKEGADALSELMDVVLPYFHQLREDAAKYDEFLLKLAPESSFLVYKIAQRMRYWSYQHLCLLREDLHAHSSVRLDRRISMYTENLCLWQRIWWSLPTERISNKIYLLLKNV